MIRGTVLRRHPAVASVVLDGEAVLLDPAGNIHVLSPSGTAVWESLDEPTTIDGLVAGLSEAYGVGVDVLGPDVIGLVEDFRSKGLLNEPDGPVVSAPSPHQHQAGPTVLPEPPST